MYHRATTQRPTENALDPLRHAALDSSTDEPRLDHADRLRRFLERLRSTVTHDLGTPLGTIANYAAILEAYEASSPADVQDLGRRVGANAQRAARMVQRAAVATSLAARHWKSVKTDSLALARVVLADGGGRGGVRTSSDLPHVEVDVEVLGYVWRSYLAVEQDARGAPVEELWLDVARDGAGVSFDLACGERAENGVEWLDVPRYLRHSGGRDRLECAMGFSLAFELVLVHAGSMRVWGQPGRSSGVKVRFPTGA